MIIVIVGSGFVGKSIGLYMNKLGYSVYFYDINKNVLNSLKKNGYNILYNLTDLRVFDFAFITVPTPTVRDGKQDLSYLKDAINRVGGLIKNMSNHRPIVIVKSTVLPGTTENIVIPLLAKTSGLEPNVDFGVIYSPEFITEISHTWSDDDEFVVDPEKEILVIGESDRNEWGDIIVDKLYNQRRNEIVRTNYKTAEMIKYALNMALATKISFWNEIFLICQKLGIDSDIVAKTVGKDPRVGFYGTVHGKAFGGKCLPKDLKAFLTFAEKFHKPTLLQAVYTINEYMKEHYGVRE